MQYAFDNRAYVSLQKVTISATVCLWRKTHATNLEGQYERLKVDFVLFSRQFDATIRLVARRVATIRKYYHSLLKQVWRKHMNARKLSRRQDPYKGHQKIMLLSQA